MPDVRGAQVELARRELARRDFLEFMVYMHPNLELTDFHRNYYTILDYFAKGRIKHLCVSVPPQHGKSLYYKELVKTANRGWVQHGDLVPGDFVFSPEGKPVKVLWNSGVYRWPCRKVTFAGGYSLVASYNHEWGCWIPDSNHKAVWYPRIETDDIMKMKHDRSPYIMCAEPLQMDGCTPVDPYQLGLWLGDGYSSNAVIAKRKDDIAFWESEGVVATGCRQVGDADCYRTHLTAFDNRDLRAAGLLNAKHIPREFLNASTEDRTSLVQGLMDSDGCCDARGNCEFCSVRRDIAEGMMELLRSLGHKPRMYEGEAKLDGRVTGPKFRVCFNPDRDDAVFRLPRKAERLRNKTNADRSDKRKHFIVSVEDAGEQLCNCIQVEGGYYLAGKELIPTHNSEGSTRNLPAFMLGRNMDLRIGIVSYSQPLARKFNKAVQRNISLQAYRNLFPDVVLPNTVESKGKHYDPTVFSKNASEFQLIDREGSLIAIGREGALTGNPLDVGILDDLYKNAVEANSPAVRDAVDDFYDSTFKTRMHDNSQELIVFTRWNGDDLIGRLKSRAEKHEIYPFHEITDLALFDTAEYNPDHWYFINFPAIQNRDATPIDKRRRGEALWPSHHGIEGLMQKRGMDVENFECLYQGNPISKAGMLYSKEFMTYQDLPDDGRILKRVVQIDLADRGTDRFVAISGYLSKDGTVYVTDIMDTADPFNEETEDALVEFIIKNRALLVLMESQAGGTIVRRNVADKLTVRNYRCCVNAYHQSMNKESKIISYAVNVSNSVVFPQSWKVIYGDFYKNLVGFKKKFSANVHDDEPDCLTELYLNLVEGKYSMALYQM